MKAKLNLTIEKEVLSKVKQYASDHDLSVSQIVEDYFETLYKPKKKESLVEFIDKLHKLNKPDIDPDRDLIKEYYEAKGKKYGF
jgi:hypothetical protein